jgi:signal transduction histidine kinase
MSLAGLMVSSVAHEVATPLCIISNIAEMLLQNVERESPIAVQLKKIVTQSQRISELTRGLLDFVRHRPAQFAEVDMAGLIHETFDLIRLEFSKAHIQVSVENNLDMPPVRGDRAQLQQVLLNLLVNAIQAMKSGGRLMVRIAEAANGSERQQTVLLTIEDTGPGIPPQTIEKMFDFFFTTKTAEGGTGLGLAICKQIIEGHDGTIRGENMESGGARFTIQLPAAAAEVPSAPPASVLT